MATQYSPTEFGERIRLERQRLGLTQEQLANLVGVKKQSIYLYEHGRTSPTADIIFGFSKAGFRIQFLLLGREHIPNPQDLAPEALKFAADIVSSVERKFADGPLSCRWFHSSTGD